MSRIRTIQVDALARVEGEGGLFIKARGGRVEDVRLSIYEPPRFFEAFLRGRHFTEAPDITARICGICPVAYQMSSVHAMESVSGVVVTGAIRELRRLLYCGEWIESHALHVTMLHAPDFLGYEDAIRMAGDLPERVTKSLQLKKVGNQIVTLVAGREIHPVNVRLGGFHRGPKADEILTLAEPVRRARDLALETVRWVAGFKFPDFERDYDFVALRHPTEYPFNEGRIVSTSGLDIGIEDYEVFFREVQVPHSNALHSVFVGRGTYCVGPLARYNLNHDRLSPLAQEAAREAGLLPVCRNPFQSIIVRAVETLYACDEALRIIESYERPDPPALPVVPRPGRGFGCTEAPRGLLYHRYDIDEEGLIVEAKIVPPTSQNQHVIEEDLKEYVEKRLDLTHERLKWECEQAVRNYDPCISCATHFLRLEMERT
jgi:sulfhydrogenase subunit alpha